MFKRNFFLLCLLLGMLVSPDTFSMSSKPATDKKDSLSRVMSQESLMREGRLLMDQGEYEKAFKKYQEAADPIYIKHQYERRSPVYGMMRACVMLKDYKKASEVFRWVYDNSPNDIQVQIRRNELDALIEWQKTDRKDLVYKVIEETKITFNDQMPPLNYAGMGPYMVTTILRLYDTIGDHDAGIAYIDEVMKYFDELDMKNYGEHRLGKVDKEYLKIRKAFEQDKAEGSKGRATRALIASTHFPW